MRSIIFYRCVVLITFFIFSPLLAAQDYPAQLNTLLDAQDYDKALALCLNWEKAEPNNPQAYIGEANCYFGKGYKEQVMVSTKKPEGNDLVLTDPKTGKVAGSISDGGEFDKVNTPKGIAILEKTVSKHPYRLDIWFGLAHMYEQTNDFPAMLSVITRLCAYSSTHSVVFVGNDGKKISEPIDKYVPETIQDYCAHFAEKGEMQKVLQISQVMTKYFPKHSYGFDNIAGYYTTHGKWSEAKKYYEIAADLAPTDSLEWSNLGKVCEMLGDETGARKNYGKVISLNNNPEVVEIAKKALAELGRSKK